MSKIITISSYRRQANVQTSGGSSGSSNTSTSSIDASSLGTIISSTDAKATPVDSDVFGYSDSADSGRLKKLLWSQIKSLLQTFFNSFYAVVGHTHTNKADLVNGVVPASQLPSYVDDVVEAYIVGAALSSSWLSLSVGGSAFIPETGKVYVVLSSGSYYNKTYRWGGSTYVVIGSDLALGETASTAYRGDYGAATKMVVDAATALAVANTLVKRDTTGKVSINILEVNGWVMTID